MTQIEFAVWYWGGLFALLGLLWLLLGFGELIDGVCGLFVPKEPYEPSEETKRMMAEEGLDWRK